MTRVEWWTVLCNFVTICQKMWKTKPKHTKLFQLFRFWSFVGGDWQVWCCLTWETVQVMITRFDGVSIYSHIPIAEVLTPLLIYSSKKKQTHSVHFSTAIRWIDVKVITDLNASWKRIEWISPPEFTSSAIIRSNIFNCNFHFFVHGLVNLQLIHKISLWWFQSLISVIILNNSHK